MSIKLVTSLTFNHTEEGWTDVQFLSTNYELLIEEGVTYAEGQRLSITTHTTDCVAKVDESEMRWYKLPYTLYTQAISLTPKEEEEYKALCEEFHKAFSLFNHDLQYLTDLHKSLELRVLFEVTAGYDKGVCSNLITKTFKLMHERRDFLLYYKRKREVAVTLATTRALIITGSTQEAEEIAKILPNARPFYKSMPTKYFVKGKLTKYTKAGVGLAIAKGVDVKAVTGEKFLKDSINAFNNDEVDVLCCVGYPDVQAELVIVMSPSLLKPILGKVRGKVTVLHARATRFTTVESKQVKTFSGIPLDPL